MTADAAPSVYRTSWAVDGGFVAECGGVAGEWSASETEAMGSAREAWEAEGALLFWSAADAWQAAGRGWAS